MIDFFSEAGTKELVRLTSGRTLYAFDFDGTLAPIVSSPSEARLRPTTKALLCELVEKAQVAVISGRALSDLRARIGCEPAYCIGNHGIEGSSLAELQLEALRSKCRNWILQLQRAMADSKIKEVPFIEDKEYSLSVHYRNLTGKRCIRNHLVSVIGDLVPAPRLIGGKQVLNLVPWDAPNKGTALLELLQAEDFDRAFYIGDDCTDEDIFSVLDGRIVSVRVGKRATSHARYFIKSQEDVDDLLKWMLLSISPN